MKLLKLILIIILFFNAGLLTARDGTLWSESAAQQQADSSRKSFLYIMCGQVVLTSLVMGHHIAIKSPSSRYCSTVAKFGSAGLFFSLFFLKIQLHKKSTLSFREQVIGFNVGQLLAEGVLGWFAHTRYTHSDCLLHMGLVYAAGWIMGNYIAYYNYKKLQTAKCL